jgi:hypothetical protein
MAISWRTAGGANKEQAPDKTTIDTASIKILRVTIVVNKDTSGIIAKLLCGEDRLGPVLTIKIETNPKPLAQRLLLLENPTT